jgi:hypothetical protein
MSSLFGDLSVTGDFATDPAASGSDAAATPTSFDIPAASDALQLDPFLFPTISAGSSSDVGAPTGSMLPMPTPPAPQQATAGTPAGNTWAPLLGFGAPIVAAEAASLVKSGKLQPGTTQLTKAAGASVTAFGVANPLKTLFDTTNQGVTGQHLILGGIVLLALVYGINKLS